MLMCVVAQVTAYATIRAELPAGCHRTVYICDDGKDPGEDGTFLQCFYVQYACKLSLMQAVRTFQPCSAVVSRTYMPSEGRGREKGSTSPLMLQPKSSGCWT